MNKIIALTDYKEKFGSKHFDTPYRSGMDKNKLSSYFKASGYEVIFKCFNEVSVQDEDLKNIPVIYTSSEDIGYRYKSYIEDVVFALELVGTKVLPEYKHLRANNNKVFMELMREVCDMRPPLKSRVFGSMSDLEKSIEELSFPCVFKESEGASGRGVALVKSKQELIAKVKASSQKRNYLEDAKDYGRALKHKGYIKESIYRDKFIVQDFIPNLKNDWKVYVFGDRLYTFKRPILKGRGIKASGGGYDNYLYDLDAEAPEGMFDVALDVFRKLNVPHLSIDIAYDGKQFYIIEFQSLYFGTAGIPYSKGYFSNKKGRWEFVKEKLEIEKVYVDSIISFLK
ncbi:ATP-grasp domain-containing protein [Aquimarina sp. AD1]|uniref:ATP-grasp domain-containing protein n=1 Tax=Aquimarina sp. (strain AD1) TaxID=1714848 RepID=UPI000E4B3287|nr:ATP-grasp domain-containing protein [Aquimarina sp. AD1]AXT58117.1 ATP-grasp domain-containing protein [Aquimarina sp. AD1]RKN26114.1 ATP-grasp domain-containing protein [Aquimarina sp. AD1]